MAVNTIVNNGASSNRVDIVFMGDGYRSTEIAGAYYDHVNSLVDYLFNSGGDLVQPFLRYKNFFNVHAIEVTSAQSGADDPTAGKVVNTALGATYLFDGVTQRLLSVDQGLADAALAAGLAGTGVPGEILFVTVNDTQYGGAGGKYATYAGGNEDARGVAVHEVGHSFALLADEYEGDPGTYVGPEPVEPNVTKDPTGAEKWAHWLGYEDPLLGTVGAFQGGRYFSQGIYRPTDNSGMRNLDRPFDPIAREQFILKFYDLVDPLDTWTNKGGATAGGATIANNTFVFMVDTVDDDVISVNWTIDGVAGMASTTPMLDLRPLDLDPTASIFLNARAFDPTDWVRIEKDKLEQTVRWKLDVDPNQTQTGDGAGNVLIGAFTHDHLRGQAGADTLIGYYGNDTLDGGANPEGPTGQGDVLLGGAGNDTYLIDSGLDLADEDFVFPGFGNGGFATIISTADFYWDTQSVGEVLRISEDVVDVGGDGATIVGGIFANTLEGHSGTDVLFGRGGSDTYRAGDGVDFMSLSTLGLDDANAYVGVDGANTVIVEKRTSGAFSYDIVFEFESGKDKFDVSDYNFASKAAAFATGVNDGAGNSYFVLGDGLDYLYVVGRTLTQLSPDDFMV